jgi:hypothetical protein
MRPAGPRSRQPRVQNCGDKGNERGVDRHRRFLLSVRFRGPSGTHGIRRNESWLTPVVYGLPLFCAVPTATRLKSRSCSVGIGSLLESSTLSARERTGDADSRSQNEDEWSPCSCLRWRHAARTCVALTRREVTSLPAGGGLLRSVVTTGVGGCEYVCLHRRSP